MPETIDHVAYLSQQIGPRPAGTEEEQQAALYITEQMQKEAGLPAVIEDFNGVSDPDIPRAICYALTFAFAAVSLAVPAFTLPAAAVSLVAALLLAAEVLGKPVISKMLARGVSQNVVAKYEPGYSSEGGTRRRKVILVAHYDSGKVWPELKPPVVAALPILKWASLGAMAVAPILLLLKGTVLSGAAGGVGIVFTILLVVALVLMAIPIALAVMHKVSAYNEGANCNASGVGVLLEVARRVGRGQVGEAGPSRAAEGVTVHGEQAARSAGLIPEGAQIAYEVESIAPPEFAPQSPEARLASAKAAVAALSGKPVGGYAPTDISANLAQAGDPAVSSSFGSTHQPPHDETHTALITISPEAVQEAVAHAHAAEAALVSPVAASAVQSAELPAPSASSESVPDWFRKAQEKAKKPKNDGKPVQRSRYAEALDAAFDESASHFEMANDAVISNTEARLRSMNDGIVEIQAPAAVWEDVRAVGASVDSSPEGKAALPVDSASTTAMPPIDVSGLRPVDVPLQESAPEPPAFDSASAQKGYTSQEEKTISDIDALAASASQASAASAVPPAASASQSDASASSAAPARRRAIALPDIGTAALAPITELPKQRAPLAEAGQPGVSAPAKNMLAALPSIGQPEMKEESSDSLSVFARAGATGQVKSASVDALRATLPSLSGSITRQGQNQAVVEDAPSNVSLTGAFAPVGATSAFAPVGDELLENVAPDDIYVDDADDSDYEDNVTESGAFAGPGYVEMPKSRIRRLFDRFRRKDKEEETTPQEWLDVDESFEARSVGAARGGWESFRDEDLPQDGRFDADAADEAFDNRRAEDDPDLPGEQPDESRRGAFRRDLPWQGGGFSRRRMGRVDTKSTSESDVAEPVSVEYDAQEPSVEVEQIYQFRNPDINTEVWFVALGSELAQNGGMRAFVEEHSQELRGSVIVELDALGAGKLCMIDREGEYRKAVTSSRMKRYAKKASQAAGASIGSASILWRESTSSFAIKHGLQAMHLVGMEDGKPAKLAQADDVLDGVDESLLKENADFVMELLKSI